MTGTLLLPRETSTARRETVPARRPTWDACIAVPSGGNPLFALAQTKATEPSGSHAGVRVYVINPEGFAASWVGRSSLGLIASTESCLYCADFTITTFGILPTLILPVCDILRPDRQISASVAELDIGGISGTVKLGNPTVRVLTAGVRRAPDQALEVFETSSPPLTAAVQVDHVQDALSLSVTQIADILGISRPTVYTWLREDVAQPRNSDVARRLADLVGIARKWRDLTQHDLGRFVTVPVSEGKSSLYELLLSSVWNTEMIEDALQDLAAHINRKHTDRVREREHAERLTTDVEPAENAERSRLLLRSLARRSRALGG